ncbi:MAG TPA: AMP-binding protein [Gemmatimonadaceae bacterium]|nr:AMP-binding protein [Gemmatimonadaceae bacterium]
MNLAQLFALSLEGRANRPALDYDDGGSIRMLTFGDVNTRAKRMAAELASRGLRRGDRLAVHLANRVEFIDLYLACVRLGLIFVPMNVLYKERELRHIVGDAEPKAVVVAAKSDDYPASAVLWNIDELARAAAARDASSSPATGETSSSPTTADTGASRTTIDGDDPAMIVYTSGTTGVAKGAVLSHNNLAANGITLTTVWKISESDRYLAMLPLFHVHGLGNGLHSWLISGSRMRLLERFDQRTTPRVMLDVKPTLVFGVPTVYIRMLDPAVLGDGDAQSIGGAARLFVSGSAPLPSHVHEAFRRRFGHTILERYGMSEALMIMSNPYEGERRAGSVGLPLPGVSARIVGDDGQVLGDDSVGEVQIRSPHLFSGYWRRAEATNAAFQDGWFKTGDLGVRAPDGYFTLRGRRGDLIISGGFNIYPREIEELLLEDKRISEAAVVGVADEVRGEVPIAYIVADDSLSTTEIEQNCRSQLASFKIPRAFVRVDSLPRTALGKIQKHLLPPAPPIRQEPVKS